MLTGSRASDDNAGMRYRLRTLLILLAIVPPLLAGAWWGWAAWRQHDSLGESERHDTLRDIESQMGPGLIRVER
jgi:hypothetical protein